MDATQDGDYRLCFDNSYSKLSMKMVFFEVTVDGQGVRGGGDEAWGAADATDGLVEYKLEDIRVRSIATQTLVLVLVQNQNLRTKTIGRLLLWKKLWRQHNTTPFAIHAVLGMNHCLRLLFLHLRQTSMDFVYRRLERSRHFQNLLRTTEARDRYLLEDNLWRVSFWSCLNLLVVLAVAAAQIYTLRRLFDVNKRPST